MNIFKQLNATFSKLYRWMSQFKLSQFQFSPVVFEISHLNTTAIFDKIYSSTWHTKILYFLAAVAGHWGIRCVGYRTSV